MPEDKMCTREEVREIVQDHTRDLHEDMKDLKNGWSSFVEGTDQKMRNIASAVVTEKVGNFFNWVGFGGVVTIVVAVVGWANLNSDQAYMAGELDEMKDKLESIEVFMNRGDRFTIDDGLDLRRYSDEQDSLVVQQLTFKNEQQDATMKQNQEDIQDLLEEIRRLHN